MVKPAEARSRSGRNYGNVARGDNQNELPRVGRGGYAQAWNNRSRQSDREAKMSAPSAGRNPWSLSLRGLLLAVALAGLVCVSLKFANDWFWIGLSGAAMLLFMAAAVVSFVGRGAGQAFAIGFILCAGIYCGVLLVSGREPEFSPYSGAMPTTLVMRAPFEAVVKVEYMPSGTMQKFATQAEAEAYQASSGAPGINGGGSMGFWQTPTEERFMAVAHVWWAVLIGYVGGRFARLVYVRRAQESQ